MSGSGFRRRDVIRSLWLSGAAAAASPAWAEALSALAREHAHDPAPRAEPDWKPRVLSEHQDATLVALAEAIIPETETPGAKGALVNRFVDQVLAEADPRDRAEFVRGLEWVDARCRELFGSGFAACAPAQQTALLTIVSSPANRSLADQVGVEFFAVVKSLTISGYYSSEVGIREELGDDGTLAFVEFPGCEHPEHGAPPAAGKQSKG